MEDYYKSLSPSWWTLQPNERRTLRQQDLFQSWQNKGARGYILAVTGFGKTRLGKMAITKAFERDPKRIVNIIVPHKAAFKVWKEVKDESKIKRIRICMAHTYLRKPLEYRKCDLLIVDECHRFTNEETELFGKIIDSTNNKWILPLSATLAPKHKQFLKSRGIVEVGQVTMKEAKECEYVADHDTYIINLPVSGKDLEALNAIQEKFHSAWKVFGYDFNEIINSLKGGEIGKTTRESHAAALDVTPETIYGLAKRARAVMTERKVFLQKATSKIEMVTDLVNMFPNENILTFGEFTDVADTLTTKMGARARSFHSNLSSKVKTERKFKRWKKKSSADAFSYNNKNKLSSIKQGIDVTYEAPYYVSWKTKKRVGVETVKKENIRLFESKTSKVNVLNTAKALDEAADIDAVSVAILWSYTKTARQTIQRIGRVIRFKPGKKAYIFILCLTKKEGMTQEEKWLKESLSELEDYKWITPEDLKKLFTHEKEA